MKLCAYCVSDQLTAGTVGSVAGIGGAQTYMVQSGSLASAVSEIETDRVEISRDNVLAHERVVQRVLAETTPLPFRFGTVVTETELQSYLTSHTASLKKQLDHVRGCVEMSVKIIWNSEAIKEQAADAGSGPAPDGALSQTESGSGTAFLVAKQRELQGEDLLKESAAEVAAWLAGCLGDSVREAVVNVQPAKSLVLAAAHLVERDRLEDYRRALRSASSERSQLHFLTSGAWPPYSFTIINS